MTRSDVFIIVLFSVLFMFSLTISLAHGYGPADRPLRKERCIVRMVYGPETETWFVYQYCYFLED